MNRSTKIRGYNNWLDVGGGQGHFCCPAREVWPETFDGVDLGEGIEEAARRRRVDRGHRGLFTEFAASAAVPY
jgi:hypothetical protein